jgi:hypothetical protein
MLDKANPISSGSSFGADLGFASSGGEVDEVGRTLSTSIACSSFVKAVFILCDLKPGAKFS